EHVTAGAEPRLIGPFATRFGLHLVVLQGRSGLAARRLAAAPAARRRSRGQATRGDRAGVASRSAATNHRRGPRPAGRSARRRARVSESMAQEDPRISPDPPIDLI